MTRIVVGTDHAELPEYHPMSKLQLLDIKPPLPSPHSNLCITPPAHFNRDKLDGIPAPAARDSINDVAEEPLHVVMVPFPLQGHINPMMQFAKALISKHGHIRITIVNNKHNHERIRQTSRSKSTHVVATSGIAQSMTTSTKAMQNSMCLQDDHEKPSIKYNAPTFSAPQEHPEENPQFLWVEDGLPPDFNISDIFGTRLQDFLRSLQTMTEPLKQLLQNLSQKRPAVSCVVFGSFCPWVHTICVELGIPSVFFWTQSASVLSIYYHAPLLAANRFFPYNKKEAALSGCNHKEYADGRSKLESITSEVVSYIPGVPPLYPSSFPTLLHIDGLSEPSFDLLREQFAILRDCQGIVIHSFEELEKDVYQALQAELPFPVALVGPLIPSAFLEGGDNHDTSVGASLFQESSECMDWLNSQKTQSVLYISFGSMCTPPAEDIQSIACGIKASKQPFLWVLRPTSSLGQVADILPKGFMDDTKDYGLIIPWAPQVRVLSHPSVGAFLTHCGWNSTLESVSTGVPMIPFPLFSDQTTNCAYVCDVWKIGMALKRQECDGKVRSMDVERVVRTVLGGCKEGEDMRERAHKLKEAARQAMRSQAGSSSIHMEHFIHKMKEKIHTRSVR